MKDLFINDLSLFSERLKLLVALLLSVKTSMIACFYLQVPNMSLN